MVGEEKLDKITIIFSLFKFSARKWGIIVTSISKYYDLIIFCSVKKKKLNYSYLITVWEIKISIIKNLNPLYDVPEICQE